MSQAKTDAQRKAAERARKAAAGLAEVRGIFAPPSHHKAIREAARRAAAKLAKAHFSEGQ